MKTSAKIQKWIKVIITILTALGAALTGEAFL